LAATRLLFSIFTFRILIYIRNMACNRSSPAAFSLIEMLIVVGLIVAMYAVLMSFGSRTHQETQAERCSDNLQKIFLSAQIYANDFRAFPLATNAQTSEPVLNLLVPRYTADTSIFICPGGRDSEIPAGVPLFKNKISYAYYMGRGTNAEPGDFLMSDRQINTLSKNAGDQVFSLTGKSPGNNHSKYGGNVLFCDDHVEKAPPQAPFSLAFSNGIVLLNPKP
jgi:type II secretory pathway pseudopilin PulG